MSGVLCTKPLGGGVPGRSDLYAGEYRAEAALVQRSIEQPVFRSHLHYPEITGSQCSQLLKMTAGVVIPQVRPGSRPRVLWSLQRGLITKVRSECGKGGRHPF